MSDEPVEIDLKFLPDWLKESPAGNRYADHQGEAGERSRRGGGEERERPPRGDRGPRRDGPPRGRDDRRGPRRDGPPRGKRDERGGGERRGERRFDQKHGGGREREPRPPAVPSAEVKIEFLPEPHGLAGIARQIKSGTRAYPLFGTARLFLERPERHRVRVTSLDPAVPLYQCGDGPISFDRAAIERGAFRAMREEFYSEETVQGEPLRGNFTNVARCRTTGMLLGPTNYHAYQPALRKLYEERFSRRMSFPDFQQHEIEIVTDAQAVADWKEQARSTTTYSTLKEAEPVTFKSALDAEQHFRKHYLTELLKTGQTLETSGPASRASGDRTIGATLRTAWESEKQFPQNIVNLLRPAFHEAGLHYFKHRKRMIFISPIRPQRAPKGQTFSEGITALLAAIEASPKCARHDLAVKILGEQTDNPEATARKAALAGDLHYLIQAGHVIEFHDGTLDLPLIPGEKPPSEAAEKSSPDAAPAVPVAEPAVEAFTAEASVPPLEAPIVVEPPGRETTAESLAENIATTDPEATAEVPLVESPVVAETVETSLAADSEQLESEKVRPADAAPQDPATHTTE